MNILKAIIPHIINGIKTSIGANTRMGQAVNANKIGRGFLENVIGEAKPVDANADGIISPGEIEMAKINQNRTIARMIAATLWIVLAVWLKSHFPEQVDYFVQIALSFLP